MGISVETLAVAKTYTDQSILGGGAIKGKNCTVDSITDITGGHRVTFKWTLDNGTEKTGTMDVMNGEQGEPGQDGSVVTVTQVLSSGTKVAEIAIDGVTTNLFAPSGGGGGSEVTVTQVLSSGTKIAEIGVDGVSTDLYAPSGSSSASTFTSVVSCAIGATSAQFTNPLNSTSIVIDPYSSCTSGTPKAITGYTVTSSTITLSFAELTEATDFVCKVEAIS